MSWRTTRAAGQGGAVSKQVAVIDLGSNSWRLVVFSYAPGTWWKRTDELYETVRIGAGLGASGQLSEAAITRGMETLAVFERFCRANRIAPEDVHVVATSAIREAANGEQFLEQAQAATGLTIETLSARDEAYFGYVAAINTTMLTDGVVLDLGGGSLQLIEVRDRHAGRIASFGLGAVRMTEQFLPGSGPAKKKELARLRSHVRHELSSLDWLPSSGPRLVGVGGAVRNLAAAAQASNGTIDLGVQGFVITPDALHEQLTTLAALGRDERGAVPGIKPGRGDIILAAAVVLDTLVELGDFAASRRPRPACARACSSPARCSTDPSPCSRTSARPRSTTSRSCTSPTWSTSSTSRACHCRCSTRWSAAGCSSRLTASASCCGPPRCSTTSA